jgi:outer membrane scaffolding protein for murein synthesis (MipA/OmpV family)
MGDRHMGTMGLTGIAIGVAIDTADRIPDVRAYAQIARTGLTDLSNGAVLIRDARRSAFPVMSDLDMGATGVAGIAIGVPVDTTDRIPDVRAYAQSARTGLTDLSNGAVLIRDARRRAFPGMGDRHMGTTCFAGIAIGVPIDTADRIPYSRTEARGTHAGLTDLSNGAIIIRDARRSAFPGMGDLDMGATGVAGIAIGVAIDTADRIPYVRAYAQSARAGLTDLSNGAVQVDEAGRAGAVVET